MFPCMGVILLSDLVLVKDEIPSAHTHNLPHSTVQPLIIICSCHLICVYGGQCLTYLSVFALCLVSKILLHRFLEHLLEEQDQSLK